MQKDKEHTTTSRLQRWLSGEGRAADERELTRQAADDAFLGEAMSGYAKHPEVDHGQALERLRGKLASQEKRRTPVVIFLRRAAAAAAIIAAAWGAWWYLYDVTPVANDQQVAARKETTAAPEVVAPSDVPAGNIESEQPEQKAIASNSGPRSNPTTTTLSAPEESKPLALLDSKEEVAAERKADAMVFTEVDDLKADDSPAKVDMAKSMPAPAESRVRQAPATTAAGATAKPARELVSGVVRDANGDPLPGVAIYDPNTKKGAITDFDGHFQISTEGVDKLRASYTGYLDQEFNVKNQDSFNLVMQEAATALDEVVITGYDKSSAKKKDSRTQIMPFATPVGGTNALDRYIKKHLKYPEAAKKQGIKGSVAVSFIVHKDGSLSDFNTISGIGLGCNEEAIRLLSEGPKWKIAGDAQTVTATYTVTFK